MSTSFSYYLLRLVFEPDENCVILYAYFFAITNNIAVIILTFPGAPVPEFLPRRSGTDGL